MTDQQSLGLDATQPITSVEEYQFEPIKGYPMLQGVRGEKRRDQEALAGVISRLSQLVADLDDEIAETDANPILLYEEGKGCRVVDARVILKQQ